MGLAYRPIRFDDPVPVNEIESSLTLFADFVSLVESLAPSHGGLVALDGTTTARFDELAQALGQSALEWEFVDVTTLYRSADELEALFSPCLPVDREIDPDLNFGKLFDRDYEALLDPAKVSEFVATTAGSKKPTLIFGLGSASASLRVNADAVIFVDITPKDAALRVYDGEYSSLGGNRDRSVDEIARQTYFVDMELSVRLRAELISLGKVDGYILDSDNGFQALKWSQVRAAMAELVGGPFRAKPVYVEGVWGGQFIKQMRGIPDDLVDKVAWSFDLIPTEASVLVRCGDVEIDVPFMSIMDAVGDRVVGDVLQRRFDGRFPARFNYDDTWHSNGNLSIQVHPSDEMIREMHGDIAAQNEAYYVVLTGHGAKTYVGFSGDGHEFMELCRKSRRDGSEVPYQDYLYGIESTPGRQVFLPHGTVHASGRNQLVLELGTITTGAYTYKLYDYLRPDITGRPRPIHTTLGERALDFDRDEAWVDEQVAFPPRLVADGEGWSDYLVGQHEDMFIEAHRVEIDPGQTYRSDNTKGFTVVTLVDGETAQIQAPGGGGRHYVASFLDVVVIPASMPSFEVVADSRHPVVIHTTSIRQDRFETWQTS